ncbi:MAG: riboflavin biosynthesis protein RibF [Desulfuromonas sp.]|nr:MAG: riboflavin biosynthesis protein RibF [Desulfuromonas sp.]
MRILHSLSALETPLLASVVTIGNFDGVHLGHRELFRKVVRAGLELEMPTVVVTFVPHPLKFLAPIKAPRLINTYAEKERLIAASCIDTLLALSFDHGLAALSARDFVRDILVRQLGMKQLFIGYDYAFGKDRQGDADLLRHLGEEFGFTVEVLEPVRMHEEVYSSTRIRELVAAGAVEAVVPLLGRHFTLEGEVVHGAGRGGGQLGFPTANLKTEKELLPAEGVYAVKVCRDDQWHDAVVNIGKNPTFDGEELTIEVHLLDFSASIYGETLRIYFLSRLRAEVRFDSVETLIAAIRSDIAQARKLLAVTRVRVYRDYLDCPHVGAKE